MIKEAPFKSEAQRRWMFANHPEIAKRWAKHTPKGKHLPEYVKKAMLESFIKIAKKLKKLPPVPMAILEQQEAQMIMDEKRKGLSPAAARAGKTVRLY